MSFGDTIIKLTVPKSLGLKSGLCKNFCKKTKVILRQRKIRRYIFTPISKHKINRENFELRKKRDFIVSLNDKSSTK